MQGTARNETKTTPTRVESLTCSRVVTRIKLNIGINDLRNVTNI